MAWTFTVKGRRLESGNGKESWDEERWSVHTKLQLDRSKKLWVATDNYTLCESKVSVLRSDRCLRR